MALKDKLTYDSRSLKRLCMCHNPAPHTACHLWAIQLAVQAQLCFLGPCWKAISGPPG